MKWDAENVKTKLIHKAEILKSKEIFSDFFGKVTLNELLTALIESTGTIYTSSIGIESRTLKKHVSAANKKGHTKVILTRSSAR